MKTKLRMHSFPGDLCRELKIAMMEKRQRSGLKGAKGFADVILSKERAVLKRQFQKQLAEELP